MAKRVERHNRAERAAADAEHYEIFEFFANVFRRFQNIRNDFFLIVGQFRPAHKQFVFAAVFFHVGVCFRRRGAVRSQLFIGKAFIAEESFRHIVVIERYAHRIAPFSGFVTHIVFTILL